MTLNEMAKKTREVSEKFGTTWSKEVRLVDMMEEVGELSNAVLVKEGHKNQKRAKAELEDSLCDVLYDLLLLSENYGVDLENEYKKMLESLEKRIKERQFQDD
jgi:NTP pyrophosphatase (non-canonical NTP hydrolase)